MAGNERLQSVLDGQRSTTPSPTPYTSVKWSRPEVLYLLSLYRDREYKFKDKKTKKKAVWDEVAAEMAVKGYNYTGLRCETKFKNLKQNFTKTVDHNNKTGNDKTCPFYEELEEIYGLTPCVKPVAVCSNRVQNGSDASSVCASGSCDAVYTATDTSSEAGAQVSDTKIYINI